MNNYVIHFLTCMFAVHKVCIKTGNTRLMGIRNNMLNDTYFFKNLVKFDKFSQMKNLIYNLSPVKWLFYSRFLKQNVGIFYNLFPLYSSTCHTNLLFLKCLMYFKQEPNLFKNKISRLYTLEYVFFFR